MDLNDDNNFDTNNINDGGGSKHGIKQIINPKTSTIIRRPRNILRTDHLISRRGIVELPKILSETKFKGKGNELEDLKLLVFKMKHWAHRLFPGLTFEDFINKTEQLGNKRIVKNYLNRIRTNQKLYFADDHEMIHSDNDDDNNNDNNDDDDDCNKNDKSNSDNNNNKNQNNNDDNAKNFDLLFRDHIEEMKNLNKNNESNKNNDYYDNNHNNDNNDDDDDDGTTTTTTTINH